MRDTRFVGVKQVRPAVAELAAPPLLWRMHQADNATRVLQTSSDPIQYGYPTIVTLGTTPTFAAGSWVTVAALAEVTELNGTWRVLYLSGNTVALDVDSTAFTRWATSGGTMAGTILQDEFKQMPALALSGTVTGVFSNPTFGLTSHSAGTNTARQTASLPAQMNLTSHAGCLVLACDMWFSSNPGGSEILFSMGVQSASATDSKYGLVTMNLATDGQVALVVRPQAAADNGASNTSVYTGALSTSTRVSAAFVLDMSNSAAWVVHVLKDGVFARSYAVTMTGSIGGPAPSIGMAIGTGITNAGITGIKFGAGTTTQSGGRMRNLLWWKTSKTASQAMRAVSLFQRRKLLTHLMV